MVVPLVNEAQHISCDTASGLTVLPGPIKRLLADAKTLYYHDTHHKTTIYRPRQKEQRRDYNMWQQVARRPVRPMQTVVLDSTEKRNVLQDVNDYLHPRTPRWYASRGIPLRRGYLFHGPPGTGKTSFSFALAGVFGIDIYVISLQDISITEEDLASLFTRLPRRCIVLLEDIDTAGLRRDDEDDEENNEEGAAEKAIEEKSGESQAVLVNGDSKAKSKKVVVNGDKKKKSKKSKKEEESSSSDDSSDNSDNESDRKSRKKNRKSKSRGNRSKSSGKILTPESISLSGLLNAIDGVASHEGRVLIMTTNKPESLDEALVRPGRVDMQVAFMNASSAQAGELFHRMYEVAWRQSQISTENGKAKLETKKAESGDDGEPSVSASELKAIANEFGEIIPEDMFSPAEIQGFLLKRKNSPRKALADARGWIEAAIKQKESKSKISTVQ
jgi:chaperone BCS1